MTIRAIHTVLAALQVIAVFAHRAVVTEFGGGAVRAVDAIFGIDAVFAVHGIFGAGRVEDEVAVFDARIVIAEITIFRLVERECPVWDGVAQRMELLKERCFRMV